MGYKNQYPLYQFFKSFLKVIEDFLANETMPQTYPTFYFILFN